VKQIPKPWDIYQTLGYSGDMKSTIMVSGKTIELLAIFPLAMLDE